MTSNEAARFRGNLPVWQDLLERLDKADASESGPDARQPFAALTAGQETVLNPPHSVLNEVAFAIQVPAKGRERDGSAMDLAGQPATGESGGGEGNFAQFSEPHLPDCGCASCCAQRDDPEGLEGLYNQADSAPGDMAPSGHAAAPVSHTHSHDCAHQLGPQSGPGAVQGYARSAKPGTITTGDATVDALVDGLLMNSIYSSGSVLTYSFDLTSTLAANSDWSKLSAADIDRHLEVFAQVTALTGVEFVEVDPDLQSANLYFADRVGTSTAYATSYNGGVLHVYNPARADPVLGDYVDHLILHELGHGLGLAHGHGPGALPSDYQGHSWSVMSYRAHPETQNLYFGASHGAETFMLADIAALQYQFGANFNAESGDTEYRVDFATGELLVDGVSQGTPKSNKMLRALWDGSGHDTLNLDNATNAVSIDLRPGKFTSFGSAYLSQLASDPSGDALYAEGNIANPFLFEGDTGSLLEDAVGGDWSDVLYGNQIANHLTGGAGDDKLYGAQGSDTLHGGTGGDELVGGTGADTLRGEAGDDVIYGNTGVDHVHAGSGADYVSAGEGADLVWGEGGNDYIIGRTGVDTLYGGAGNDQIFGSAGADHLFGDADDDRLSGGSGEDRLEGGSGDDRLYGNAGIDRLWGQAGEDRLYGGSGNDQLFGGTDNDRLYGMIGADILNGEAGADRLFGGSGDDRLEGGTGNDRLEGNQGLDTLIGGAGDDILRGGTMADAFVFRAGDGHDRIEDFNLLVDHLVLSADIAGFVADGVVNPDGFLITISTEQSILLEGVTEAEEVLSRLVLEDSFDFVS